MLGTRPHGGRMEGADDGPSGSYNIRASCFCNVWSLVTFVRKIFSHACSSTKIPLVHLGISLPIAQKVNIGVSILVIEEMDR